MAGELLINLANVGVEIAVRQMFVLTMHQFTAITASKNPKYPGQFHDRFIRVQSVFD